MRQKRSVPQPNRAKARLETQLMNVHRGTSQRPLNRALLTAVQIRPERTEGRSAPKPAASACSFPCPAAAPGAWGGGPLLQHLYLPSVAAPCQPFLGPVQTNRGRHSLQLRGSVGRTASSKTADGRLPGRAISRSRRPGPSLEFRPNQY